MDAFGLNTGTFGAGLWRNRVAVRIIIVAIAIVLVGVAQPLNGVSILATSLLVTGLLVVSEILQRPVVAAAKKRAGAQK
jgi:hypothetical protein